MPTGSFVFYLALAAAPAADAPPDHKTQPVFAPPPAPPRLPGSSRGPTPKGNPGDWVTEDDYPMVALRDDIEGTVGFVLAIAPDGRPTSCKVESSSYSEALDTHTCKLLTERARFHPATDPEGRPVEGRYRSTVRWVIPEGEPEEVGPAEVVRSFVIGTDGRMRDCMVEKVTGKIPEPPQDGCDPKIKFIVPLDAAGKPITRRVRVRTILEVDDLPAVQ